MSVARWLHEVGRFCKPSRCPGRLAKPSNKRRAMPRLESLEDRCTPSTLLVTTSADNGDNVNPLAGSLRKAITDANANAGPDTIVFNIPTTDSGFVDVDSG